jgi:hypothetical protein
MYKATLILTFITFIISKNIPTTIYNRTDPQWANDTIYSNGQLISYRPDIIEPATAKGTQITLFATTLKDLGVKCQGNDCTPGTLNALYTYNLLNPGKIEVFDELKLREFHQIHAKDGINWYQIYFWHLLDSEVFFITHPHETNGKKTNFAGSIYEMHIDYKLIKYYDDFGNFGEINFDQVAYIELTRFENSLSKMKMKFLE